MYSSLRSQRPPSPIVWFKGTNDVLPVSLILHSTSSKMMQAHTKMHLKGWYDVAKNHIILCIWCNVICLRSLRKKKHYFPHIVHYFCSSLKSEACSDWPLIQCIVIGRIPQAFVLHPLPYLETPASPRQTILQREYKLHLLSLREHLGGVMQIFPHSDIDMWDVFWMGRFRKLNFDKEYLFGFLVLVTLQILYIHKLVTLQRQRKTWNRIMWPV